MTADSRIVAHVSDRVLYVLVDRAEKRNALSRALLADIGQVFREWAMDTSLVAAVITGAGDKCFAAGGDLYELDRLRSEADGRAMALHAREALNNVRAFPVPVVAALNGDALGGGAELAASCDFRIAAPHARIGFIQGKLCISTAWGGGIDLMRIVGRQKGLRLLSTAQIVNATEALSLGLLDGISDSSEALGSTVEAFLEPVRALVPQSQRAFKAVARATCDRHAAESAELDNFAACWGHPDHWVAHDSILHK